MEKFTCSKCLKELPMSQWAGSSWAEITPIGGETTVRNAKDICRSCFDTPQGQEK